MNHDLLHCEPCPWPESSFAGPFRLQQVLVVLCFDESGVSTSIADWLAAWSFLMIPLSNGIFHNYTVAA